MNPHETTLVPLLAEHPLLRDLPPALLEKLAACAMKARFEAGQNVFREGDPANRFYLILSGRVVLSSNDASGRETLVQTLGPGDVLGWSWLFPPYYWHFDARTTEPVEAIFFYGTRLREQCETDHDLGYALLKRIGAVVVERLQATRLRLLDRSPGQTSKQSPDGAAP